MAPTGQNLKHFGQCGLEPLLHLGAQVQAHLQRARLNAEVLGLDPFHIANEGKAVLGVRPDTADSVLAALKSHPQWGDAAIVGTCIEEHSGRLILDTGFGKRLMTEPEGEPLPRIC